MHWSSFKNIHGTALRGRWANIKTARIYITDALVKLQEFDFSTKELEALKIFKKKLLKAAGSQTG